MPLGSILLDSPQQRAHLDQMSTLVSGRDWDPFTWGSAFGTWVDPITNRAMLEPAPRNAAWTTSSTGLYAKLGAADFALSSTDIVEQNVDDGGPFLWMTENTSNAGGNTTADWDANQAFCVEWFAPAGVLAPYGIIQFGITPGVAGLYDASSGVAFDIYSDGQCGVAKNGAFLAKYSISGKNFEYYDQQTGSWLGQAPEGYHQVIVIPCSDREVLVVCPTMGGGFSHVFIDLLEGVGGQTITPAAKFWFMVLSPIAVNVRVAKVQFAATGTICGRVSGWRADPGLRVLNKYVYESLTESGHTTLTALTSGIPNPYSIAHPIQLKVALTAVTPSGLAPTTPIVYGARAWYDTTVANTAAPTGSPAGLDVTDYCRSIQIEDTDALGGLHATATLMSPSALDTLLGSVGDYDIRRGCARVMVVNDAAGLVGTLRADPPVWDDAFGFDEDSADRNQDIEFTGHDLFKLAEKYVLSDPWPADGLTLKGAYEQAAKTIGLKAYVSPSATFFVLPLAGVTAAGGWAQLFDVGEKGSDMLDRLHTTFAANWYHGIAPDGTACLVDPADPDPSRMPSVSAITLYRSIPDAIDAGVPDWMAPYRVYRSFKQHVLEPEANDITVVGMDPRSGRPIVVHYSDLASSDPTTALASRPANWMGSPVKAGWVDPMIATKDLALVCLSLLQIRLTAVRTIGEFSCEWLDGIGKGQLVTLDKSGLPGPIRLKTRSSSWDFISDAGEQWRPTRYVGEAGPLVCPLGVPGTSIAQIRRNWAIRSMSKFRAIYDGVISARRPAINVQV